MAGVIERRYNATAQLPHSRGGLWGHPMRYLLVMVALLALAPLTLIATSSQVSARRVFDNPNYGYCPGTLRRVADVRRCRPPGAGPRRCVPGGTCR